MDDQQLQQVSAKYPRFCLFGFKATFHFRAIAIYLLGWVEVKALAYQKGAVGSNPAVCSRLKNVIDRFYKIMIDQETNSD